MSFRSSLISGAFLLAFSSALAVGVDQNVLPDPEKEAFARSEFKKYRCLVCQNQSIEDSDAELAADLRAIIREQVAVGKDADEIETFLVDRYGDWVLLNPRAKGLALGLWLFPLLLLGGGAVAGGLLWRRNKADKPAKETTEHAVDQAEPAQKPKEETRNIDDPEDVALLEAFRNQTKKPRD